MTGPEHTRRGIILTTVSDLAVNFLHYDRKEDEELDRDAIPAAIEAGEITVEEIVRAFDEELRDGLTGLATRRILGTLGGPRDH